jgi:hypothetical protein
MFVPDYRPEYIFSYTAQVQLPPEVIGPTPDGIRANFYVIGEEVEGPKLKNSPLDKGIRYSVSFGINVAPHNLHYGVSSPFHRSVCLATKVKCSSVSGLEMKSRPMRDSSCQSPVAMRCAAEIDDHLNRGRNMDTRTPDSQCRFVA